jgi:hypothetical protein
MIDLTATSPLASPFYGNRIADDITSQDRYIDADVKATLASGYIMASSAKPSESHDDYSEDLVLAKLGPLERWRYLAKHNRSEFIFWLLALLVGAIMFIVAGVHLGLSIFSSALAQNVPGAIEGSSHDLFDWAIAGLMSACLLWCLGIVTWAQAPSKISFGKDTSKTIIGFVIGFLSGRAR